MEGEVLLEKNQEAIKVRNESKGILKRLLVKGVVEEDEHGRQSEIH